MDPLIRGVGQEGGQKKESKGGGNWEKLRKILQHFVIFFNRNGTKRRGPHEKGREAGVKCTGSGRFRPQDPPVPTNSSQRKNTLIT